MKSTRIFEKMDVGRNVYGAPEITDLSNGYKHPLGGAFSVCVVPVDPDDDDPVVLIPVKMDLDDDFYERPFFPFGYNPDAIVEIAPDGIDLTKWRLWVGSGSPFINEYKIK